VRGREVLAPVQICVALSPAWVAQVQAYMASYIKWWARQPPYEAAFLEGFLGFIKMLIQRVPTKMPTKLPRGRRSVRQRAVASRTLVVDRVRSNHEGSLIAISRESIFEVGPARGGRLSVLRRALAGRQKNWLAMA
jgi:hypothetical protein